MARGDRAEWHGLSGLARRKARLRSEPAYGVLYDGVE